MPGRILIALLTVIIASQPLKAQTGKYTSLGLGYSLIDEQLPEGVPYAPMVLLHNFRFIRWGKVHVYAEGQFTHALDRFTNRMDYEIGLNLRVAFQQEVGKETTVLAAVGTGPHFITVETDRQANGFIFSDNFELGFVQGFPRLETAVILKGRYRHISNAGLKNPNGGIDNLFLIIGLNKGLY